MKKKKAPSAKKVLGHFTDNKLLEKADKLFDKKKLADLGLTFTGLNFISDGAAGYTCDLRIWKPIHNPDGTTQLAKVCVQWSDGQDHSNDPDVPDTL